MSTDNGAELKTKNIGPRDPGVPTKAPPAGFPVQVEVHVDLGAQLSDEGAPNPALERAVIEAQAWRLVRTAFEVWADEGRDEYGEWIDAGRLQLQFERTFARSNSAGVRVVAGESLDLAARRRDGMLRVRAFDRLGPRRDGFWVAMLAAQAVAAGMSGQLVDPARRGLGPVRTSELQARADGRVHVGRHISVPASFGSDGLAWLTTLGLDKFGLPELELRFVPPNMVESSARVLAGAAQVLLERDHPLPRILSHPLKVPLAHVQWALGLRPSAIEQAAQSAEVELHERRLRHAFGRRLELQPPRSYEGRRDAWPQRLMRDLVGPPRSPRAKVAA